MLHELCSNLSTETPTIGQLHNTLSFHRILMQGFWTVAVDLLRAVGAGGAGCAMPPSPQILADQLTLFQPGGTDYAHLIATGTPEFSDLPTALYIVKGKQGSEHRPPGLFTKLISTSVSMTAGINFGGKNFPPLKVSCDNSQLWWLSSMRNPWEKLSCPKTFRASELKMKTFCHVRPVSLKRVQLGKKMKRTVRPRTAIIFWMMTVMVSQRSQNHLK